MTETQLEKVKEDLVASRNDLLKEIGDLENTDFGNDIDSGEEETDETEEAINNESTKELLKTRLRAVEDALEKIEKGTYGICENCNAPLSAEMIEIDPESRLCRECKQNEPR